MLLFPGQFPALLRTYLARYRRFRAHFTPVLPIVYGCFKARTEINDRLRMTNIDDRREPALCADDEVPLWMLTASSCVGSMLGAERPVLDAQALIDGLGLGSAIGVLRIRRAFPAEAFALAALSLLGGYAEFVEMLPMRGLGSDRFGRPGGQLQRGPSTVLHARDRRRGQMLPHGVAPEVIGAQAHRWTYSVFVTALLRDVALTSQGLRVRLIRDLEADA